MALLIECAAVMSLTKRIPELDGLRGLAAFAVVIFHYIRVFPSWPEGVVKSAATYGAHGVDIFFVISGFVIPYALYAKGYTLSRYWAFLAKRLIRLDPPYIASGLFVLAVLYAHAIFYGRRLDVDTTGVLLHLGYLNAFFNHAWLNPVYWTLAIEFQYYLLIGLTFGIISHRDKRIRMPAFGILLGVACFTHAPNLIVRYLPLFLTGIALFQFRAGITARSEAIVLVGICLIVALYYLSITHSLSGLFAVIAISRFKWLRRSVPQFLGTISYSLYLTHWTLGELAGNIRRIGAGYQVEFLFTLLVAIAGAYLFYLAIERPSCRWAANIKYKDRQAALTHAPARVL